MGCSEVGARWLHQAGTWLSLRRLSSIHHLSLPFFNLHLLVLNDDSFVYQLLETDIVTVEELELNVIVETMQELVLFPLIGVDIFWGIPRELDEAVEVFVHTQPSLFQIIELPPFHLHQPGWYEVRSEIQLEFSPSDCLYVWMRIGVSIPPISSGAKHLVRCKQHLLMISTLRNQELLLHRFQPVISL